MALTRAAKETVVNEVATLAAQSQSLVAAEYRGMTAFEITALRQVARESDVVVRVVKNNLAQLALEGTDFECAKEHLTGHLVLAFSRTQPTDAPRVFRDFSREHETLTVRFGVYEGAILDAAELRTLAAMPSREEALAKLMATMQAPIAQLARTTAEIPGRLARTLAAHRDSRQDS